VIKLSHLSPTESPRDETIAGGQVCRFCGSALRHTVVDLGLSPLCESFVPRERLEAMEPFYPLHARVCGECFLVQLPSFVPPEEIFEEYAYFSAYSDSWVEHGRRYTEMIVERLGLTVQSLVVELASNDGYLLQHFAARGIPVLGVEPARNVAAAAVARGVPTRVEFFGRELARELAAEGVRPDLVIGNNVLAQVPDLNGFVAGIATVLAPGGTVTIEVPHVLRLLEEGQYDTIYHEHFSYFSLSTARRIFHAHGLELVDVEELPTHGGSLRIHARHAHERPKVDPRVTELLAREEAAGLLRVETYTSFGRRVEESKRKLLDFLVQTKREGRSIVGYGAPGKGNTLLNYCGIRTDFLDYTVDRNPYKHGRYTPGTRIPIYPPERIAETRPDYILILPWNLRDEIVAQLAYAREWGARFVVPIPDVEVIQ
jgi:SAM-dependent methyltransferase